MASSVNSLASPNMIPKTSRSFSRREHAHRQCQDSDFAADQCVNIGYNPLLSTLPSRQQADVRLACHQHPIVLHVGPGGGVHHPIPLVAAAASFNIWFASSPRDLPDPRPVTSCVWLQFAVGTRTLDDEVAENLLRPFLLQHERTSNLAFPLPCNVHSPCWNRYSKACCEWSPPKSLAWQKRFRLGSLLRKPGPWLLVCNLLPHVSVLGVLVVVIGGTSWWVASLLLLFFLARFRLTGGLLLVLRFGLFSTAVGGIVGLRSLCNGLSFGLPLCCLLSIRVGGSKSVEVQIVWEVYDERVQFMSRHDALQLDEGDDVSRAWLVWCC